MDISDIIFDELSYAYCDNCRFDESDSCEYCHRKSIAWAISKEASERIANKIIGSLEDDLK